MEIEVSAFGNFSTDTGNTDCTHRSLPSVPHGANLLLLLLLLSLLDFVLIFLACCKMK